MAWTTFSKTLFGLLSAGRMCVYAWNSSVLHVSGFCDRHCTSEALKVAVAFPVSLTLKLQAFSKL
jgi:hypothetical protein